MYCAAAANCIYLYEAKREEELSVGISADVPLLSPVVDHGWKRAVVHITVVGYVSFTCTTSSSAAKHCRVLLTQNKSISRLKHLYTATRRKQIQGLIEYTRQKFNIGHIST